MARARRAGPGAARRHRRSRRSPGTASWRRVDGRELLVGNSRLMAGARRSTGRPGRAGVSGSAAARARRPCTWRWTGSAAGSWRVADTLKPESAEAVRELQALGLEVWMLTGDNEAHRRGHRRAGGHRPTSWPRCCPSRRPPRCKELQAQGKVRGDGRRRHQRRARAGAGRPRHRHRHRAPTWRWRRRTSR